MIQRLALGTFVLLVVLGALYLGQRSRGDDLESLGIDRMVVILDGPGFEFDSTPKPVPEIGSAQESAPDIFLVSTDPVTKAKQRKILQGEHDDTLGSLLVTTIRLDGELVGNVSFRYFCMGGGHALGNYFCMGGRNVLGNARSDEAGSVLLQGLVPGQYLLIGENGGSAKAMVMGEGELFDRSANRTTLLLPDGIDVKGFVVDSEGRGIGNASIWIGNHGGAMPSTLAGQSHPDGSFHIQPPYYASIRAQKDGYVGHGSEGLWVWAERYGDSETIELDLALEESGPQVRGVVITPTGEPIAGALVHVDMRSILHSNSSQAAVDHRASGDDVADENGEFQIAGLVHGTGEFLCSAPGYAMARGHVRIGESGCTETSIEMQRGAWLRGVMRTPDGTPVDNVKIYEEQKNPHFYWERFVFGGTETWTAMDGSFELGPLPVGKVRIKAEFQSGTHDVERVFEVVDGASYQWDYVVEGLPTISGKAEDSNGNPLAGWKVVAHSMGSSARSSTSVVSGVDGTFEIQLTEEKPQRIELYGPDFVADIEAGGTWRRVPRAWMNGVADGSSQVRLIPDPTKAPTGKFSAVLEGALALGQTAITVRHDELGNIVKLEWPGRTTSFEIPDLPVGNYSIKIESQGFATRRLHDLNLLQGQHMDLGTLTLQAGGGFGVDLQIDGKSALDHAIVELLNSEGRLCHVTRRGARVEGAALPVGQYTLCVQAVGCGPAKMDLTIVAGECNEYELPLAPGGPLGFALLDADGQDLGGDVHLTVTAANGTTVLDATVHCDEFQNWPTGHNRNSYWYFAPFGDLHVVAEVVGSVRCETKIQFSRTGGLELPHALKLH